MKSFLVLLLGLALASSAPNVNVPFSTKIFHEVAQKKLDENVILSPASIRTCLGLAFMGAKGTTSSELYNVLQLSGDTKEEVGAHFEEHMKKIKESGVDFKTANRMYLANQYKLAPKFEELVSKYFDSTAEKLNFADSTSAAKAINSWVEEQTNNKIHDLISPDAVDSNTKAVLVNAIFFKALWKYKFKPNKVQDAQFYMSENKVAPVRMMHETMTIPFADLPAYDAKAIEIPYANTDIHMLVILPNQIDGLSDLEDKLKDINLSSINLHRTKVKLSLPKFKIQFGVSLNQALSNLGLKHMFSNGDFSGITSSNESVDISNVEHKAFIEVDEQGTEASAATAVFLGRSQTLGRDLSVDFIANHPFFFAIRDESTVYFAGHVTKF